MAWWSARVSSAVEQHVRDEVLQLIPQVQSNPEIVSEFVVNPVLLEPVSKTFSDISRAWSGDKKDLRVTVSTGDDPNYGDGTATHVAIVGIGEHTRFGLRILCDSKDSPMFIAGVWTP
jgi:hypothetical protein